MNNLSAQQKQMIVYSMIGVVVLAVAAIILSALDTTKVTSADVVFADVGFSHAEDGVPVLGNPDAPITIVEFADFQCSHCQQYKSTINQVIEELVKPGLAKFEFRIFPVINQDSYYLGNLLECTATLQGDDAYWQAYELLFGYVADGIGSSGAGRNRANELGMQYADLLECTDNANQIAANVTMGSAAGVEGTPAIRLRYENGDLQTIEGSERAAVTFEQLQSIVQAANAN